MANEIKYSALKSTITTITGSSSGLRNLTNASLASGSAYDNSDASNRNTYAEFELLSKLQSGAAGSPYAEVWILKSIDGSNYEDGGPSTVPARPADIVFNFRASVATSQRMSTQGVTLPPTIFKCLLRNSTGQSFTNVDDENILYFRAYNVEVQ